jgi:L-fucose mutarotase
LRKRFLFEIFDHNEFAWRNVMGLKGITGLLSPDLLWALASMGHGDELSIVDHNFSGERIARKTVYGKLLRLDGVDAVTAIGAILNVMPLDHFVAQPLAHMEDPQKAGQLLPVHAEVEALCSRIEGRKLVSRPIERFAYYPLAECCIALIQTAETRPYGNFILKKGVV